MRRSGRDGVIGRFVLAAILVFAAATACDAAPARTRTAVAASVPAATGTRAGEPFMQETGPASVPYGWLDFCNRYAGECDGANDGSSVVAATAATLKDIEQVNRTVNASVRSVTDMEHWGVIDRWDYPLDGKGDCEDFALLKRKILIAHGLPRAALLMTVVKDHVGEGHAVLTVHTSKADIVLDNMVDPVLRWDETGYRFVKRQSAADQNRWNAIGAPQSEPLFTAR